MKIKNLEQKAMPNKKINLNRFNNNLNQRVEQEFQSLNNYQSNPHYFMSPLPTSKPFLQQHLSQLQLLNPQQLISKLKFKKQQIIKQSSAITKNCHEYFINLTSQIMQIQNKTKKIIDKQVLNFIEEVEEKIQFIKENENSYNTNNEVYQVFKILSKCFVQVEENVQEISKVLEKAYTVSLKGVNANESSNINFNSDIDNNDAMSTNKIYISESEFITTNKKVHGSVIEITEKQFQLALMKFQQRQQKNMLINEKLKNKIKALEQALTKKGISSKDLSRLATTGQKEKYNQDFWDLQLQRIKGQNNILTEQINNISNKLIQLTSQNQALKGQYKKMIHSNISHISNNNTVYQQLSSGPTNLEDHSRLILMNGLQSQNIITSQIMLLNPKQTKQQNDTSINPCFQSPSSNIHANIQNQMLIQLEKKNQNLSLQLTKKLKQSQQLHQLIQKFQKQNHQLKYQLQQSSQQFQKLSHHCSTLQHDYQISSKKRFELEQKLSTIRQSLNQSVEKQKSLQLEHSLQKENLENQLRNNQQTLGNLNKEIEEKIQNKYKQKISLLQATTKNLQNQLTLCRTLIKQSQTESQLKQQNFKSQFKRLQKTIATRQQQLKTLRQQFYQLKKQLEIKKQKAIEQSSATWKQKYQVNKKQLAKIKKEMKELVKQNQNLKAQYGKVNELLGVKIPEINGKIQLIVIKQMEKIKERYEGKIRYMEERMKLMKERFEFQFVELAGAEGIKNNESKKLGIYIEQVQKYIQTMQAYCNKTIQTKRLKQQNKDLKTAHSKSIHKPIVSKLKPQSNKQNASKSPTQFYTQKPPTATQNQDLIKTFLTKAQQLSQIQKNLFQDRYKLQKSILQEKINVLEDELKFRKQKVEQKQAAIKQYQQQLTKLRKEVKQIKKVVAVVQKQQANKGSQNANNLTSLEQKQTKSLQTKLQKQQQQIKTLKNHNKKLQQQLNQSQLQIKKKKQHVQNIKKDHSEQQDKIQELNFLVKNKSEQIEKYKRQLKDYSTKENLVNQMKEKLEAYTRLQAEYQEAKKSLQKQSSLHKFQTAKLNAQIKLLKQQKHQDFNQKLLAKTNQYTQQIASLKQKNKKYKSQIQRKDTLIQLNKSKYENEIGEARRELEEMGSQLNGKIKEMEACEKKLEIVNINMKKYKDRAKLLTIVVKKVYEKLLEREEYFAIGQDNIRNKTIAYNNNQNSTLLHNTSPINHVFNSNVFNNNTSTSPLVKKQKQNLSLSSTLAQLDFNLQDLQKYSQGLQIFGLNTSDLKNLKSNPINHNETLTSNYMNSPQNNNKRYHEAQSRNQYSMKSPTKTKQPVSKYTNEPRISTKQKVNNLTEQLSEKVELNVQNVIELFQKELSAFNR